MKVIESKKRVDGGRNGTLNATYNEIVEVLGFEANEDLGDGGYKSEAEFHFSYYGRKAGLWAYRQGMKMCTNWSIGGDVELVRELFYENHVLNY